MIHFHRWPHRPKPPPPPPPCDCPQSPVEVTVTITDHLGNVRAVRTTHFMLRPHQHHGW
jgi:hypothetical protein